MVHTATRKLIFRLGKIGFLLDLDHLVEICEQVADHFDSSYAVIDKGIIGVLTFRQTQIPLVDPALTFGLSTGLALNEKKVLVLKGEEGNWALLVDRVGEITLADNFLPCEIPPLLKDSVGGYYSQVSLLANEPLIHYESIHFFGPALVP